MEKTIVVKSNWEAWEIEDALKKDGYQKFADCFWYIGFKKDDEKIWIERQL